MNAGKSKLMVGRSGGKMNVNLENDPVVSVGKECRQTLFSVQYVKKLFTSGTVCAY